MESEHVLVLFLNFEDRCFKRIFDDNVICLLKYTSESDIHVPLFLLNDIFCLGGLSSAMKYNEGSYDSTSFRQHFIPT